jgi:Lysylphosphatidylglycerol synthase TM region
VRLERLALAAGVGLFLWLLHRIGLAVVWSSLLRLGWGFAAILMLESVVILLATLAWRQTLPRDRHVPFASLLAMRVAGDGVNALAPAAVVGGELVRAGLLTRFVGRAEAIGSVGLAALTQFLSQVLFVGVGAMVIRGNGLEPRLRVLGVGLLSILCLMAALLARLSQARSRDPKPPGRLLERLGRVFVKLGSARGLWQDVDRQVFGAVRERPGRLLLSLLLFLLGWLVSVAEVFLILALLGAPVSVGIALSIAVLMVFVEGALFFVPGRVGVEEGGLFAIFGVLGLNPVDGFSLGLTRRLREIVWGLLGLGLLAYLRRGKQRPKATREETNEARPTNIRSSLSMGSVEKESEPAR